jgi:putative N-acetyltransferase (TIGR04045 family)
MVDNLLEPPRAPFRSRWILAQPATEAWLRDAYFALRRQVFVAEQALFAQSDVDEHDACALPIVALATCAGVPVEVVGVVRIYQQVEAPGAAREQLWYGGRLAVAPTYRRSAEVGAALIRAAVGAARAYGASRFLATVQSENVAYFTRHHFRELAPLTVCGRPHALMEAELAAFTPPVWSLQGSFAALRAGEATRGGQRARHEAA